MISAAQSAHTTKNPVNIMQAIFTVKLVKKSSRHFLRFVNIHSSRNSFSDYFIQLFRVDMFNSEFSNKHSAANVNADNIGNDLLAQVCRESDDASRASMNIWHNANLASVNKTLIAKRQNLLRCLIFNIVRKHLCGRIFSFNRFQLVLLSHSVLF